MLKKIGPILACFMRFDKKDLLKTKFLCGNADATKCACFWASTILTESVNYSHILINVSPFKCL
jgi:hypothetical protein